MSRDPLVECVPNISEGRDIGIVDEIVAAARSASAAKVLHVDRGHDANRTVVTIAGPPQAVADSAYALIERAAARIDLRLHRGTHPRIGAADVVPFVPLSGIGMAECTALSYELGARVAARLGLPVYYYQCSARTDLRRELSSIRRGGFEGLVEKMRLPEWLPDEGAAMPHPSAGATVIGARDFLVAFNVHLGSSDESTAKRIAADVRRLLSSVKAIGWSAPSYGIAQVSTNVMNFRQIGLHETFTAIERAARARGAVVEGSEIIGLVPRKALVDAGRMFGAHGSEDASISVAIDALGLTRFAPFDPSFRVLEERLLGELGWSPEIR